jgi:hypothetical protein
MEKQKMIEVLQFCAAHAHIVMMHAIREKKMDMSTV